MKSGLPPARTRTGAAIKIALKSQAPGTTFLVRMGTAVPAWAGNCMTAETRCIALPQRATSSP